VIIIVVVKVNLCNNINGHADQFVQIFLSRLLWRHWSNWVRSRF